MYSSSRYIPLVTHITIGQGFNTYTQEIRIENAVRIGSSSQNPPYTPPASPPPNTANDTVNTEEKPNGSLLGRKQEVVDPNRNQDTKQLPQSEDRLIGTAIDVVTPPPDDLPFELPPGPTPKTSQSVTYSTRAIENVSDIMDALNISTSMSIKYGTIHGNGNASFVNETKVLDSELNYVVSVVVNNDALAQTQEMEFQEIPGLPLNRFTEVYGDSFISGFTEGGVFNAVISVKLNDKSKHKAVKQAVDVQLAVGPPTLEVGGSESFDKDHTEALKDTEITISVNWVCQR